MDGGARRIVIIVDIGPAPEFRDGLDPAETSAPVEITRWKLGKRVGQVFKNDKVLAPKFGAGDYRPDMGVRIAMILTGHRHYLEVYHLPLWAMYESFWRREDPITQLAPGTSDEHTVTLRMGISKEHAREVARSLGVTGKGRLSGLSAQLSDKTSTKVTLSQEKEEAHKVILTNPFNDRYYRIAIWHVAYKLSIAAVREEFDGRIVGVNPLQTTEFALSDATVLTSWPLRSL